MAERSYGQYCGLARALDLVGERWALLLVRDLLVSPKRFSDLRRGLPRIPSNILTTRLKELEAAGIVERRVLPLPERGLAYALTPYGADLEDVVIRLGRWGAASLGEPRPGEILTPDALVMALRALFRPSAAGGVRAVFQLEVGPSVLHARVAGRKLTVGLGPAEDPDLVIVAGPGIRTIFAGEVTGAEALAAGSVTVHGDAALLDAFAEMFHLDSAAALSA